MSRAPSSSLRKLALAGGAVLLFAGAAVLLVTLATSTGPGPSSAPAATVVAPAPAEVPDAGSVPPPPLPKDTATGLPVLPTGGPSAAPPSDPLPPQPPKGSWEAVPPAARASTLGPLGAAVGRELLDLQPRLSACFDEVSQARHGQQAVAETQDGTLGEGGATVLMLEIEASSDEVLIVDAPVESRGGAGDGLIACAQQVLRGQRIAAPGAKPGQRFRLMHSLTQ
jgi:hypothetical protein